MVSFSVDPIDDGEAQAIEPGESSECPDPQISVWSTGNGVHRVLREPVDCRPLIEAVLERRSQPTRQLRAARHHSSDQHG
jgi:hypothetical protein